MRLLSLLQGKCPHCLQAHIFASFWRMNEFCPHCGIKFEREVGYFSMAIFMGYILAAFVVVPFIVVAYLLNATFWFYIIPPSVAVVLASPIIFRYARIWWLYIDEWLDPRRPEEEGKGKKGTKGT